MTYHTDAAALRWRLIEWLVLLIGLLIVAAALAYTQLNEAARHDAAERERLSVLTALLAKNIEVDLAATNRVLEGVIRDYLADGAAPDAGLALPRRLAALVDAMPGVRTMLVIDVSGKPVATNIPELAGQDFSRRGYFQTARDAPDAHMLCISAPFLSFKGDLVITASRMVQDKQGRFAGVVVATFDLAQGMALWLDEVPYRQHLSRFGNTYGNTVGAMRALLGANARSDAAALAHKLAGVAGSLALPATLHAAQQAEQLLHAGDDAAAALDALEQALVLAIEAAAAFTAQAPLPGTAAMPETQHGRACQ